MDNSMIGQLVKTMPNMGLFKKIKRCPAPYNMERSLRIVEAIGRSANKKFVIDADNRFVYENIIRWIHSDPSMVCLNPATRNIVPGRLTAGLYIAGNTGTGKSWCLDVMSAYANAFNIQISFEEGKNRPLSWSNVRADAICEEYCKNGNLDKYKKWSIIGVQDFGAEPEVSMYMGNRLDVIRALIEFRGDNTNQLTLMTSNLPLNHFKLADRYGDRVASRLAEMCNYFELNGADRRRG